MSTPVHRIPSARLLAVLAAACSLAMPASLGAQARADGRRAAAPAARFDSVRALVTRVMEENGLPSVSLAVAKDGRIIWEEAFGWADRERMMAATPHTLYSLASISKPMTAAGVMKLVERGLVDLDRPINNYLGAGKLRGINGDPEKATVRRVLSHTAGLPLHYQFFYADGGYERPTMDETIARYALIMHPPGDVYQYSNLGYGILDHLIARVSGRSYADFMRTEIFLPLGMFRTSVDVGPGLEPFTAQRYDSQQRPIPFYTFDHPGGSAVYSSAHDLVRFGMFFLKNRLSDQKRILADSTIDLMHRVATPGSTSSGYGLGWGIGDDFGHRRISHTGGMPGVSTLLFLYPEQNVAIVVMTNRSEGGIVRIDEEIAVVVLPKYSANRALRRATDQAPSQGSSLPTPELAGTWTGTLRTYDDSLPLYLIFQPDGDVHVRLGDQLRTLLNGASFQNGALVGRFAGRIPSAEQGRHPHSILLNVRLNEGTLRGQASAQTTVEPIYYALSSYVELTKVEDRSVSASELATYVGSYVYSGSGLVRRVFEENGRLKLEGPSGPRSLQRIADHVFIDREQPDVRVQFHVSGDRATGFRLLSASGPPSEATRAP